MNSAEILHPLVEKPLMTKRKILYPTYICTGVVKIPRLIGGARTVKTVLMVDGRKGKIVRCDAFPRTRTVHGHYEVIDFSIGKEKALDLLNGYLHKIVALRYRSYWEPEIQVESLLQTYKLFWMI